MSDYPKSHTNVSPAQLGYKINKRLCTRISVVNDFQEGRFHRKFKPPPSYAGNWPPLLILNGAMDGSNGSDSQSSAAMSFNDGVNPISDIFWGTGGFVISGACSSLVALAYDGGTIECRVVDSRRLLRLLHEATKCRRKRDT